MIATVESCWSDSFWTKTSLIGTARLELVFLQISGGSQTTNKIEQPLTVVHIQLSSFFIPSPSFSFPCLAFFFLFSPIFSFFHYFLSLSFISLFPLYSTFFLYQLFIFVVPNHTIILILHIFLPFLPYFFSLHPNLSPTLLLPFHFHPHHFFFIILHFYFFTSHLFVLFWLWYKHLISTLRSQLHLLRLPL